MSVSPCVSVCVRVYVYESSVSVRSVSFRFFSSFGGFLPGTVDSKPPIRFRVRVRVRVRIRVRVRVRPWDS